MRDALKTSREHADSDRDAGAAWIEPSADGASREERGQTLIELIVVMTILGIVLTPISASFASSLRNQATVTRREDAQARARSALQRMRLDIHCAHATTLPVQANDYGGFTLTLPENPGQCPGVVPRARVSPASSGARSPTPAAQRDSGSSDSTRISISVQRAERAATFETDYIAPPASGWPTNAATCPVPTNWAGNIWPTADTCTAGSLPTIAVDINVVAESDHAPRRLRADRPDRRAQRRPLLSDARRAWASVRSATRCRAGEVGTRANRSLPRSSDCRYEEA